MPGSSDEPIPSGRLDVPTLRTLARRADSHPLVDGWSFEPSSLGSHHLDVLFSVLDWVRDRVDTLDD